MRRAVVGLLLLAAVARGEMVTCLCNIALDGRLHTTQFPLDIGDAALARLAVDVADELLMRDGSFDGVMGEACEAEDAGACAAAHIESHLRRQRDACRGYGESGDRRAREAALEASRDPCTNAGGYGTARRRVALAFWGVNRSLNRTLASIRSRIFAPLARACVAHDVYVATFATDVVHNPRASEFRVDATHHWRDLLDALRPVDFSVTRQADFVATIDVGGWLSRDYDADRFARAGMGNLSFVYHLCDLHMLREVTRLWKPRRDAYAAVVYLRPDMRYLDDLDVVQLLTMRDGELAVPFFQTAPGHPSDVFAFGTPAAAAVFGERLRYARSYAARDYLNSHVFLGAVLEAHGVAVHVTGMRCQRVRATGHVAWLDTCMAAPWCVVANEKRDCRAFTCWAGRRGYGAYVGNVPPEGWTHIDAILARGNVRAAPRAIAAAPPRGDAVDWGGETFVFD